MRSAYPADQIVLIRMSAQFIQDRNFCPQYRRFTENINHGVALHEAPPQRTLGLESGYQDQVAGIFDSVSQVMKNPATLAHA